MRKERRMRERIVIIINANLKKLFLTFKQKSNNFISISLAFDFKKLIFIKKAH